METKKFRGLKNTTSAERLSPGFLEVAQNLDLDDTGKLLTRLGDTLALSGAYHSLWSDECDPLVSIGPDLYRVNADLSKTLVTRLTSSAPLSYVRQLNTIYASNGTDSLRIRDGRPARWGTPRPTGQPAASAAGGGDLPPGRYRYALTYRRADGYESGTGLPALVTVVDAGSALAFADVRSSPDPDVVENVLYLSSADGEELYQVAVLPISAASYTYRGSATRLGARLETVLDSPAPAGTILEIHAGVMYVVQGSTAWHSRPYEFERFRLADQFLQFPGPVTLFAAVNDGIYVGTDERVWFLSGSHPSEFKSREVFDYGAIPGTSAKTTVGVLTLLEEGADGEVGGKAVMWTSTSGVCIGADGGRALNLTERNFGFPTAARGAALVRSARGYTQYLSVLEGAGEAANTYS